MPDVDWWKCTSDDNPFNLTPHQRIRVESYLYNRVHLGVPSTPGFKQVAKSLKTTDRECFGKDYQHYHNFCRNICTFRAKCRVSTP